MNNAATAANETTTRFTTTDASALIRAALKAKGWNSRKISIRTEYASLMSAIRIKVLDPSIPIAVVREIALRFEEVRRGPGGEILNGANRYVDVEYAGPAYVALVKEICEQIPEDGSTVEIRGYRVRFDRDCGYSGGMFRAVNLDDFTDLTCCSRGLLARQIITGGK
jgi:hypothetical protein